MIRAATLACLLIALSALTASAQRVPVRGIVSDSASRAPLAGAYVEITGTRFSTRSADDGSFALGRVPHGVYALRIVRLGYAPRELSLAITPGDTDLAVIADLAPAPIPLAAVVVTPGFYGVMQPGLTAAHTLSRHEIETAPQLGEDIYRAVARLPGVANNDMSARFSVRGAPGEELYATLDGLELDEPFHLKDIDAALSILDVNSIAGVELATGGFSAEYGNRLTGVFTMHSVEPRTDRTRTTLSLSILNARYAGQGGRRDGRLGWYVAARRGYLDLALKLTGSSDSLSPAYHDVFAKVYYDLPRLGRVTLHTLLAGDHLNYYDGPEDHLLSKYGTNYVWGTWESTVSSKVRQRTVLSMGRVRWNRGGDIHERGGRQTMFLDDRRGYGLGALRQDWQVEASPSALLRLGVEAKAVSGSYDYESWILRGSVQNHAIVERVDTSAAATSANGTLFGAYLSQRVRVLSSLTAEAGLRYDAVSYSGDADVSPRVNLAWDPFRTTTVRAAWGHYTQPQQVYGLAVGDGVTTFSPAERAEQRGIGVEQRFRGSLDLRLELYERRLRRQRPRFLNQSNQLVVFPELEVDRLRIDPGGGRARGVETLLRRAGRGASRTEWSLTYALAEVVDRIGDREVPRGMDQRHTVNADWAFRPHSNRWRFSMAWLWHSGWPATPQTFVIDTLSNTGGQLRVFIAPVFGELNSERLPEYHRFDMRWTRYFDSRRGRVALYADVFNLFNSPNPRGYDYSIFFNPYRVSRAYETLLPRLPSLGVSWEF